MANSLPARIDLIEVGPREGFQFEGIGQPDKISTPDKARLVEMLADVGLKTIQMCSFVSPRQVPQMADAEALCGLVKPRSGVNYTGIYLNDTGLQRAIATNKLKINGKVILTASETFSLRNQKRNLAEDFEMQRKIAALYRQHHFPVVEGGVMAAFGCNYEGVVPIQLVLDMIAKLHDIAAEGGDKLQTVSLSDTMGWADPELIHRTVGAVRTRWPNLRVTLHLHDTRALAIANVYAALQEGVDQFDSAVGGLGGCPFAGHKGAAGNVCTEEVVFLCQQIGVETGVDLDALVECSRFAEKIVGHPLPSKLLYSNLHLGKPTAAAA